MTADDIDQLRQLAKWHERQARYLLLTVADGQHDGGRFHNAAAARLLRLVSQIEQKKLPAPLPDPGRQSEGIRQERAILSRAAVGFNKQIFGAD